MENSKELIRKIQRKDKHSRYVLIALLILNLAIVWWAVSYVLGRIDKFERTIDCKLLIIPEDRSKAKFVECNSINLKEVLNPETNQPTFNDIGDENPSDSDNPPQSSMISIPDSISPLPNINIPKKTSSPPEPEEKASLTPEEPANKEIETRLDPVTNKLQCRVVGTLGWQESDNCKVE